MTVPPRPRPSSISTVERLRRAGLGARGVVQPAEGSTAKELLRIAESFGATLIVVGDHGPRIADLLLGGVAQKVLKDADCSVLLVRRRGISMTTTVARTETAAPTQQPSGTVRSLVPARLDRLPWTRFHWLVVTGLGVSWILDGLEIQIVALVGTVLVRQGHPASDHWRRRFSRVRSTCSAR